MVFFRRVAKHDLGLAVHVRCWNKPAFETMRSQVKRSRLAFNCCANAKSCVTFVGLETQNNSQSWCVRVASIDEGRKKSAACAKVVYRSMCVVINGAKCTKTWPAL